MAKIVFESEKSTIKKSKVKSSGYKRLNRALIIALCLNAVATGTLTLLFFLHFNK